MLFRSTVYYTGELNIEEGAQISENVTFEAAERTVMEEEAAASTYTVEDFGHNVLTINIVDEEGNPVEGAVKMYKSVEAQGIFLTLAADGNYEIVSGLEDIAASEEDPSYDYLVALDSDASITVTVAEAAGSAGGESGGESAEGESEGGEGAPEEMQAAG